MIWRTLLVLMAMMVGGFAAETPIQAQLKGNGSQLELRLDVAPGWHVASEDVRVAWTAPEGVEIGGLKWSDQVANAQVHGPDTELVELKGKVTWTACSDTECRQGSQMLLAQVTPAVGAVVPTMGPFFWTLLLAFAGGALLNLAPCVLPVIGLKVLHWVGGAGEDRRRRLKMGCSYAAGLVISFLAMGALLIGLRHAGDAMGWGFHMQNPIFVAMLTGLFFVMGLSLLGLFEMGLGLSRVGGSARGAFFSGVVTTLAAAACIGPLFGPVFGMASLLPAAQALLLYTMVGIGMAAPYMMLTAAPQLLKWLPKPGQWLHVLQQVFGFMLLAAAVYFLWVFDGQTGGAVMLAAWLLPLAVGAWIYGTWGHPGRVRRTRWIAYALSGILAITSVGGMVNIAKQPAQEHEVAQGWESYSAARLKELRAKGTPVLIDVTARWCLICQANKKVLHAKPVKELAERLGIVRMEADWTDGNAEIKTLLQQHQRDGVPLYLLYDNKADSPAQLLPQRLDEDKLLAAMQAAVH
jgi:thiol:disulfide interchange protein